MNNDFNAASFPQPSGAALFSIAGNRNVGSYLHHTTLEAILEEHPEAVTWRDQYGRTPLMAAAANGQVENVRRLLAAGAEADARDPENNTALMLAAYNGSERNRTVAALLLDAGADVNAANKKGKTPLMEAGLGPFEGMMELLLGRDANPELKDAEGRTAAEQIREKYKTLTGENEAARRSGNRGPGWAVSDIDPALCLLARASASRAENARIKNGLDEALSVSQPLKLKHRGVL